MHLTMRRGDWIGREGQGSVWNQMHHSIFVGSISVVLQCLNFFLASGPFPEVCRPVQVGQIRWAKWARPGTQTHIGYLQRKTAVIQDVAK
jgi:hypothetical protein